MKVEFEKFYRERGVRNYNVLGTVRVWPIRELPQNSIVHYLTADEQLFPREDIVYVQKANRRVLLKNYLELKEGNHSQNKIVSPVNNLILDFLQKNPKFQNFIKPLADASDPDQLVFCNYNLVKNLYKYSESNKFSNYFKWLDRNSLMWSEINEICQVSSRNHFYDFDVPEQLPSKSRLNNHIENVNTDLLKYFPDSQSLFLLDLWRWLNPETRDKSCIGKVDVKHLPKCNILFHIRDGQSAVINLGYLNSWIAGQPNQTDRPNLKGIQVTQLQVLFLKFLIDLQSMSVELLSSEREAAAKAEDDRQDSENDPRRDPFGTRRERDISLDNEEDDEERAFGSSDVSEDFKGKTQTLASDQKLPSVQGIVNAVKSDKTKSEPDIKDTNEEDEALTFEENLERLEKEVQALEEMEQRREELRGEPEKVEETVYDPNTNFSKEELEEKVFKARRPEDRMAERLDEAVTKGSITAADFRKITKELEAQETKPDPLGSKRSLKEMTTILPEDITFDQAKTELATDERCLDKSMSRSVIESMDRDYVRKTFAKDVISSIMGAQSAGVLVSNIDHETHHSVLGSFESFAVTLKPIDGKTSVLRMKFPSVEEDGTFKSNGVRYHMRKQRVDLPIRKINATRVGLSSYFGKLFVFISPKKADSALTPVLKHLTAASIGEVENISKVKPANVFDNLFKAPLIYSALSGYYKSFEISHPVFGFLEFDFEHHKRHLTLAKDENAVKAVEKDGKVLVGKTAKGHPIVVGLDNHFTAILPNGEQPLGDIFDILSLDRLKAPVDPSMVKVRGATLPVGLILGRTMGLKALLKLTNAKYRLVKGRQQKNLQPFEYAISFQDYSLILDRREARNSLIFGGFDVAAKFIKGFPIASFEKKEVYEDVFDSMGGNVTVNRELDLLETSYVDPITQSILKDMNEPETFLGLLIRSSEMLTYYHHPDSQDLSQQQIRGYERFAGTMYRELMRSIRAFRNKNISGRSKIEMSPFAVHQALMEDRSVKTCEDINPIQNLKMHESVTFAGEGGRDKDAFMAEARAMTVQDAGVFSEASVDSGDVGYNIFLSSNPMLKNLRGVREEGAPPPASGHYYSTSMLLAVGSAHDDQLVCFS